MVPPPVAQSSAATHRTPTPGAAGTTGRAEAQSAAQQRASDADVDQLPSAMTGLLSEASSSDVSVVERLQPGRARSCAGGRDAAAVARQRSCAGAQACSVTQPRPSVTGSQGGSVTGRQPSDTGSLCGAAALRQPSTTGSEDAATVRHPAVLHDEEGCVVSRQRSAAGAQDRAAARRPRPSDGVHSPAHRSSAGELSGVLRRQQAADSRSREQLVDEHPADQSLSSPSDRWRQSPATLQCSRRYSTAGASASPPDAAPAGAAARVPLQRQAGASLLSTPPSRGASRSPGASAAPSPAPPAPTAAVAPCVSTTPSPAPLPASGAVADGSRPAESPPRVSATLLAATELAAQPADAPFAALAAALSQHSSRTPTGRSASRGSPPGSSLLSIYGMPSVSQRAANSERTPSAGALAASAAGGEEQVQALVPTAASMWAMQVCFPRTFLSWSSILPPHMVGPPLLTSGLSLSWKSMTLWGAL